MNGHVRKRSGYWRIILELGDQAGRRCPVCVDRSGRSRCHWADEDLPDACPSCGGELEDLTARRQEMLPGKYSNKKVAEKAMHDAIREREQGDYVPPTDLTVRQYLEDHWLPALGAEELAPATIEAYKLHVRRILPYLGNLELQKLGRGDVARMAARLAEEDSKHTSKPLSPQSRRAILVALHRSLGDAMKAGLIRMNPAAGVKRPRVTRPEMHVWTREELSAFLRATRDDRLGPLWHLLAMSGLRRGEALGLKWSDVDLEAGHLAIQRQRVLKGYEVQERPQTKTRKGRPVSIDVGTVAALRRQSERQLADADEWGDAWQVTGHVFTREDGSPWHPDRVRKLFEQRLKTVDVPRIRMHDLRHTWATLALRAGVNPKVVQERLGHANIAITMDIYSHVLPDLQESAAELVAALVDAAGEDAEAAEQAPGIKGGRKEDERRS